MNTFRERGTFENESRYRGFVKARLYTRALGRWLVCTYVAQLQHSGASLVGLVGVHTGRGVRWLVRAQEDATATPLTFRKDAWDAKLQKACGGSK